MEELDRRKIAEEIQEIITPKRIDPKETERKLEEMRNIAIKLWERDPKGLMDIAKKHPAVSIEIGVMGIIEPWL